MMCHNLFPHLAKLWLSQVDIFCSGADFSLSVNPSIAGMYTLFYIMKYSLNPSIAVPLVLCDSRALYRLDLNRLWALAHTVSLHVITFPPTLSFICTHPPSLLPPKSFFFFWIRFLCASGSGAPCSTSENVYMLYLCMYVYEFFQSGFLPP